METVLSKGEQVWILEVTPETLYADARRMDENLVALEGCIRALHEGLSALSSMWTGEAHEVFDTLFAAQCQELAKFCTFSMRLKASVEAAAMEYVRCEAEVGRMAGALLLASE